MSNEPTDTAAAPAASPPATLPAESPAPPPSPAETTPAPAETDKIGLEGCRVNAEFDKEYAARRKRRDVLLDKSCDVLEAALDGNLPDSGHTQTRVNAALAIVNRGL